MLQRGTLATPPAGSPPAPASAPLVPPAPPAAMSLPAIPLDPDAKPLLQLRAASGGTLVLPLPAVQRFDALRLGIRDLFGNPPGRYKGARLRIDVGLRELDLMEIRRIVHMCKDEFEIEVIGIICESTTIQRMAERELRLKISAPSVPDPANLDLLPPDEAPTVASEFAQLVSSPTPVSSPTLVPPTGGIALVPPISGLSLTPANVSMVHASPVGGTELPTATTLLQTEESGTEIVSPPDADEADAQSGERVLTVRSTIRSGACVRFAGDVQVFGDVNPGAQIIAGGNILVFGALKGMAHAGFSGSWGTREEGAVIVAFDLRPTQLRIGKVIGVVPGADPDKASRGATPEMASVLNGTIMVETFKGKLPVHLTLSPA